jgi:hypothetical protein
MKRIGIRSFFSMLGYTFTPNLAHCNPDDPAFRPPGDVRIPEQLTGMQL